MVSVYVQMCVILGKLLGRSLHYLLYREKVLLGAVKLITYIVVTLFISSIGTSYNINVLFSKL